MSSVEVSDTGKIPPLEIDDASVATTTVSTSVHEDGIETEIVEEEDDEGRWKAGSTIQTRFGPGLILKELLPWGSTSPKSSLWSSSIPHDRSYVIQLSFGLLYTPSSRALQTIVVPSSSSLRLMAGGETTLPRGGRMMALNAAYEALERMRLLNWEVQCHEMGFTAQQMAASTTSSSSSSRTSFFDLCQPCLIQLAAYQQEWNSLPPPPPPPKRSSFSFFSSKASQDTSKTEGQDAYAAYQNMVEALQKNHPIKQIKQVPKGQACLVCGTKVCPKHASTQYQKEKLTICETCQELLGQLDSSFLSKLWDDGPQLEQRLRNVVDMYDRLWLILTFSGQAVIADLATTLQTHQVRNNAVGLSTGSVSFMSGAMGIAGAAMLLTPAGPPLLIASVLFSGTSAAVSVGHSAVTGTAQQQAEFAANRIILLFSMVLNLVQSVQQLHETLLEREEHLVLLSKTLSNVYDEVAAVVMPTLQQVAEDHTQRQRLQQQHERQTQTLSNLATGVNVTRRVNTALSVGTAAAGTGAAATTGVASTLLTAIPLVGTAMTAAFMAYDVAHLTGLATHYAQGSPSEKAILLRELETDIAQLPSTESLEAECQAYLQAALLLARAQQETIDFTQSAPGKDVDLDALVAVADAKTTRSSQKEATMTT